MDNTERRKLNRLLRKPGSSFSRSCNSSRQRPSHKPTYKQPRPSQGQTEEDCEDATRSHELSLDVVKLCSEMCGVANMSSAAALLLQKHVNKIGHLLVHSILRVMEQSRRGVPQASDVDCAAVMVGLEPPFGTAPVSFLPIRTGGRTATSGPGGKVFFIRPDKEIDVKALLLREPAGVVYDVSLVAHWLSVNGKQPVSPQNPSPDFLARMHSLNGPAWSDRTKDEGTNIAMGNGDTGLTSETLARQTTTDNDSGVKTKATSHPRVVSSVSIDRRPHEVGQEVMIYFRELTEACVGASENRRHEALENATQDPGLQPVLPHLVTFIAEGVRVNVTNHNLAILIYLMRLVKALVDNPHIFLEPYLHILVPTVTTCVLNRQLCAKPSTDNHWALRDFAAKQLVTLCNRHNTSTNELFSRMTKELSRALHSWIDGAASDPNPSEFAKLAGDLKPELPSAVSDPPSSSSGLGKPDEFSKRGSNLGTALNSMNTLYGILIALAEFGAQSLRVVVFPVLPALCHRLTNLVEPPLPPATDDVSGAVVPLLPSVPRLSAVDQRSFDCLKTLMTNRIAPHLADWRTRQALGVELEDYRAVYGCLATCLHRPNAQPSAQSTVTAAAGAAATANRPVDTPTRLSLLTDSTLSVNRVKGEESATTRLLVDRPIHLVPISR